MKCKVASTYYDQISGQIEVLKWEIKSILLKIVNFNMNDWSRKLYYILWAYLIAYMTLIGASLYQLVYEKE